MQTQNIPITEYGLSASGSYSLTGSQSFTTVPGTWQEKAAQGKFLAQELHDILVDLRLYQAETIYPIMSILEPFIEATGELSIDMPPKSSRRVTINITRRGRAKPEYFAE
jgi:hypothetical protein